VTAARVLVVDADVEVCLLIARRLTVTGYEVLTAQSADAARSLLEAAPVDCVVVAKTLPGMHGAELIATARTLREGLAAVLVSERPEPFSLDEERTVILSRPFKTLSVIDEAVAQALAATKTAAESLKERLTQVVAEMSPLRGKRE